MATTKPKVFTTGVTKRGTISSTPSGGTSNQQQVNAIISAVANTKGKPASEQVAAINKAYTSTGGSSASGTANITQKQYESAAYPNAIPLSSINTQLANLNNPTIGVNDLTGVPNVPTLPNKSLPTDVLTDVTANNALIQTNQTQENQVQPKTAAQMIQEELGIAPPEQQESYADLLNKGRKKLQIDSLQQAADSLTAEIGAIDARANAQILSLEGQGRGQTTSFLGGEQARIQREAAIATLPLQAQLLASQGNLDRANKTLDIWFQAASQDITNEFNYNMKLYDVASQLASTKQQNIIEDKRLEKQFAQQKELEAIRFNYDKIKSGWGGSSAPTIKTINGVDYQWDANNSQWIPAQIGGISGGDTSKTADQLAFLRTTIQDSNTLSGASGKGIWDRFAGWVKGSSKYNQLESKVDTLKTNILTLNTDPTIRKFFGPQMTNRDVELMTSAGTTLNTEKNTPDQLTQELQRYDDLLARMQSAIKQGQSINSRMIIAPNGDLVEIID